MSIRTSLYTVSRRPTSILPASASTSTRIVPQSPRAVRTPTRQITTTRPSSSKPRKPSLLGQFFGIKPREPPPIDPAQVLRDASDTLRVLLGTAPLVRPALLHKPYEELVSAALSYRSKQSDPLDLTSLVNDHPQQVEEDIRRLAGDPRDGLEYLSTLMARLTGPAIPNAGDLELAIRVYGDMPAAFGRAPSWEDEICLVRARAMLRQPSEAMEVLERIEPPPGSDSAVWALVTCANVLSNETRPSDGVRAVMRTMAAKGIEPPLGAWCALLGAARPEEMNAVLRALPESIRDEPRVWAVALEGLGANATKAKEVADTLRGLVERQGVVDTRVWAALVARGEDPYDVVRAFDRAGGKPDEVLLRALVRAVPVPERTLDALRKFESLIGVEADEGAWSVLVEAAVERGEGIVGVWSAASESGMSLSSETLDRVVGSAQVSIVDKLVVYRAVNVAWPVRKGRERERQVAEGVDLWMRREDALSVPGPTVKTYSALLGALVAQRGNELDKTTSSAAAVELLTDMRARGIKLPQIAQASTPLRPAKPRSPGTPLSALASLTILLMENAPSHEAAFKTYAYACVVDPTGSFGAKEYRAVLKTFASLRIPRTEDQILKDVENWSERPTPRGRKIEVYAPPPAALYYEIMRDMQKAGCDVTQSEYSTVLRAYAAVCLELPEETDENELVPRKVAVSAVVARAHNSVVLEHIQRVHTLLKLDTNLTPDTALFNSLMLAYSRAGAWENVLAIWNGMKERDAGSISIVLDTLGRSGRANLGAARTLWEQLRRKRVPLSVNNWTSWVEALCRLGEFDEAERVVFSEMREVDEKTLRTLVSFAWRVGRQAQVLDQARRRFPGVI